MEDNEYLKCHFYRKLELMLLWAKITSIRKTEAETQKLVVCSLIAAQNGSKYSYSSRYWNVRVLFNL